MPLRAQWWFLMLLALAAACRGAGKDALPAHELEGSLTALMDLGYDTAQIDLSAEEVSVRFVRKRGEGEDNILKVTASLLGTSIEAGASMDLAETTPLGTQRGVISRDVVDDPRRVFPHLARGQLMFASVPAAGQSVLGEMAVTFENGIKQASGRTVFGNFQANVP